MRRLLVSVALSAAIVGVAGCDPEGPGASQSRWYFLRRPFPYPGVRGVWRLLHGDTPRGLRAGRGRSVSI